MAAEWLGLATTAAKIVCDKVASWHENNKCEYAKRKTKEHKEKDLQELESKILHFVGNTQHKSVQKYLDELNHYIKQKGDFIKEKKGKIEELAPKTHKADKLVRYAFRACILAALLLATLAYIKH